MMKIMKLSRLNHRDNILERKKKKKKSHATETKTNKVKKQISIVTTDKLDGKITKRKTKGHNHGCLAKWQNNKKKYKGTQTWMSS